MHFEPTLLGATGSGCHMIKFSRLSNFCKRKSTTSEVRGRVATAWRVNDPSLSFLLSWCNIFVTGTVWMQ